MNKEDLLVMKEMENQAMSTNSKIFEAFKNNVNMFAFGLSILIFEIAGVLSKKSDGETLLWFLFLGVFLLKSTSIKRLISVNIFGISLFLISHALFSLWGQGNYDLDFFKRIVTIFVMGWVFGLVPFSAFVGTNLLFRYFFKRIHPSLIFIALSVTLIFTLIIRGCSQF